MTVLGDFNRTRGNLSLSFKFAESSALVKCPSPRARRLGQRTKSGCYFLFCPSTCSFDPAVLVTQWYNLQLETRKTGVRTANLLVRSRLATQMERPGMQLPSIQVLHLCPRSFDRAVMQALSQPCLEPEAWSQWRPDLFRAQP